MVQHWTPRLEGGKVGGSSGVNQICKTAQASKKGPAGGILPSKRLPKQHGEEASGPFHPSCPAQHSCMHLPFSEPRGRGGEHPPWAHSPVAIPPLPLPHESLLITLVPPDISAKSTSPWHARQVLPTSPPWTPAMGWVGLCRPGSSGQAPLFSKPPSTGPTPCGPRGWPCLSLCLSSPARMGEGQQEGAVALHP